MISILIVDDEQEEREGIKYLIDKYQFPLNLTFASNGKEAWALFEKRQFDIVLSDIKMPYMNGLELCENIRGISHDTLIIILSAYGDFEYTQKAIKIKVDDYLLKPVDVNEFHRAISDAVDEVEKRHSLNRTELDFPEDDEISEYIERIFKNFADKKEEASDSNLRIVASVVKLIEENYSEDIGLEWIAGKLFLSSSHLSRIVKKATGKNITQIITMLRMYKAKKLLSETNMKIVDVGNSVGYYNNSYFCMLFKKYYGITANQLREQQGKAYDNI